MEQIINADAACQSSGIILLTNSISPRQHWAQNHSLCTSISWKLFEELGITSKEDIWEVLKPHLVKQRCRHLEKIISSINDTMNPFASTIEKEYLSNIANGKAALGETTDFLTKVWAIGFSARDYFMKDCNDDSNAYQSTIKRQRIKNFVSEAGGYKVLSKNKSLFLVSVTRNLFGSILHHALKAEVRSKGIDTRRWNNAENTKLEIASRAWKKSCIKSICKYRRNNNWWYVRFSLAVPTSTYFCWPGRSFDETSL